MNILCKKLLVVVSLVIVSCSQTPAVVENKGAKFNKYVKTKEVANNPFRVEVKRGDNLYKLSKKHGVGIRNLIELNRLNPPYKLSEGQIIKLPQATFHVVKKGDTVFAVSRSYGVDMGRLLHSNNISKPYVINEGMKLRIPSKAYIAVAYEDDNKNKGKKLASVVRNDLNKLSYSTENPKYVLPNEVKTESQFNAALMNGDSNLGAVDSGAPRPSLRSATYPSPKYKPGSKYESRYQKAAYSYKPLRADGSDFSWPTSGNIVSRFGPKKGGLYNDGINIVAKEGDTIKAAKDGVVVYSGNELRGYGNLILVKHNNGYVTSYAHAKNIIVKKGDKVAKGQAIASIGDTGHVKKPQLHFSIRKGRKAIDPQKYLPRG